jgi:hypothetical protein
MLAELAAANAAFAIIKKTVANSQDLFRAGKAISDFVNAEEDLKKRADRKKNSFWLKVGGKDASDLEEFMALEELKKKRQAIEQAMIYYGRPGLHSDWVKFQAEARKRRIKEQAERIRKRQQLVEILVIAGLTILGGAIVIYFAFFIALATKG